MLFTNAEARNMYCPFKFLSVAHAQSGQTNPVWSCEGPKCMAWQKKIIPVGGEGGYCGLTEKPAEGPNS
jgi:hypothetical protein